MVEIIKTRLPVGTIGILYGSSGVGKSTLAASAPNAVFCDVEGGLNEIDCHRTPQVKSWENLQATLEWFHGQADYQTLVIDSLDAAELLLFSYVCKQNSWKNMEQPGFGKGYAVAVETWRVLWERLDRLKKMGRSVILTAHEQIRTFQDPTTESYDQYTLRLNKNAVSFLLAQADVVLFMQIERMTVPQGEDARAVATGKRICHSIGGAAWIAKSRFPLAPKFEIPYGPEATTKFYEKIGMVKK